MCIYVNGIVITGQDEKDARNPDIKAASK